MDKSHLCHLMCRDKDDLLLVHIAKITTKITKIPTKMTMISTKIKKIPTEITKITTKIPIRITKITKITTKITKIPTKIKRYHRDNKDNHILSTWVEITLCVAGRTTVFSGLAQKWKSDHL